MPRRRANSSSSASLSDLMRHASKVELARLGVNAATWSLQVVEVRRFRTGLSCWSSVLFEHPCAAAIAADAFPTEGAEPSADRITKRWSQRPSSRRWTLACDGVKCWRSDSATSTGSDGSSCSAVRQQRVVGRAWCRLWNVPALRARLERQLQRAVA